MRRKGSIFKLQMSINYHGLRLVSGGKGGGGFWTIHLDGCAEQGGVADNAAVTWVDCFVIP